MNNINLIGRLTKDPELRTTKDDLRVCAFTLAVDDVKSKEDRVDFFLVEAFGNKGELCGKYLRKGFLAGVSGRLKSEICTDSEDVSRYQIRVCADDIRFLQWPERGGDK